MQISPLLQNLSEKDLSLMSSLGGKAISIVAVLWSSIRYYSQKIALFPFLM